VRGREGDERRMRVRNRKKYDERVCTKKKSRDRRETIIKAKREKEENNFRKDLGGVKIKRRINAM
jgi:hypothetical protein